MTSDEPLLLSSLSVNPVGDTARLVYADYLDENDRPLDAALQRILAEPHRDDLRSHYADVLDRLPEPTMKCPDCKGKGRINVPRGGVFGGGYMKTCRRCEHTGVVPNESGNVRDRNRAELIRVQLELAKHPATVRDAMGHEIDNPKQFMVDLRNRESDLLAVKREQTPPWDWIRVDGLAAVWSHYVDYPKRFHCGWRPPSVTSEHIHNWISANFRRGFVEEVECCPREWFEWGDRLRQKFPIMRVALREMPVLGIHRDTVNDPREQMRIIRASVSVAGVTFNKVTRVSNLEILSSRDSVSASVLIESRWRELRESLSPRNVLPLRWPGIEFTLPG